MIDKKDLRIGNSVMLIDRSNAVHLPIEKPFVIVELKTFTVELAPLDIPLHKVENFIEASYADLEPIPLTEELLVKCGFQYLNGRTDGELTLDILHYEFDFVEGELVTKSRYEEVYKREKLPHIKSLHQLQNLYYALTKQELTIEI